MVTILDGASVVGYRQTSFKGNDGSDIHGYNVYFVYPLTSDKAKGSGVGYCYASIQAFRNAGLDIDAPISVARVGQKFEMVRGN